MTCLPNHSFFGLQSVSDARPYSPAEAPNHGLDPEETRFQSRYGMLPKKSVIFALIEWQAVCILPEPSQQLAAVQEAARRLENSISQWADTLTYYDLGCAQWLPEATDNSNNSTTGTQKTSKKNIESPNVYGYIHLAPYLGKALHAYARATDPFSSAKQEAEQLAQKILADILPTQAFMFIAPDELAKATQEAIRISRELFDQSLQYVSSKSQPTPKPNEPEIKSSILRRLRGFRNRHDARMHFMPYTALYAPETGVATIAIIASEQQSISGDYGRASLTRRSLEKSN
jgi:hypothetical protein